MHRGSGGGDQNTYVFDSTIATMGDYANGMWDVMLRDDGHTVDTSTEQWNVSARSTSIVADRDFSADDFNEEESTHVLEEIYAPRAALYEILPDFLLQLTSPCYFTV